jgi:hypothetical protein
MDAVTGDVRAASVLGTQAVHAHKRRVATSPLLKTLGLVKYFGHVCTRWKANVSPELLWRPCNIQKYAS